MICGSMQIMSEAYTLAQKVPFVLSLRILIYSDVKLKH
jgi:hypothetical protein